MSNKKNDFLKKENHLLKIFLIFSVFLVIFIIIFNFFYKYDISKSTYDLNEVCINEICVKVEIVKTEKERAQGLMYRHNLPNNEGMLFVFENEDIHKFWMKNTFISLDIIWIDNNFKIVDIISAEPCIELECEIYEPKEKALYVLELNKGFAQREKIFIGDYFDPFFY